MTSRLILIGVAVLMGSGSAWASPDNPFGFETHKHPREYVCRPMTGDLYRGYGYACDSAPREHPDLSYYSVQYVSGVGACLIQGTASKIPFEDFPGLVTKFQEQITEKYGPEYEILREGEKDNPGSFMATYYWIPKEGTPGIGDVAAIRLLALGREPPKTSTITIRAYLTTVPACRAAMDRFDKEEVEEDAQQGQNAF